MLHSFYELEWKWSPRVERVDPGNQLGIKLKLRGKLEVAQLVENPFFGEMSDVLAVLQALTLSDALGVNWDRTWAVQGFDGGVYAWWSLCLDVVSCRELSRGIVKCLVSLCFLGFFDSLAPCDVAIEVRDVLRVRRLCGSGTVRNLGRFQKRLAKGTQVFEFKAINFTLFTLQRFILGNRRFWFHW